MTTSSVSTGRVVGIRLEGPMQSWALKARGARRHTHTRPTKSGVIGLVANALGRDRTDSIDDLAALRFGVRIDRPGRLEVDYHTTGGGGRYPVLPGEANRAPAWWGARGGDPADPDWMNYAPPRDITEGKLPGTLNSKRGNASITTDEYLADASFLVALEGEQDLIDQIAAALAAPARTLSLGRKAYAPAVTPLAYLREGDIEALFAATSGAAEHAAAQDPRRGVVDVYLEPRPGERGEVVSDQPVTFDGPIRRAARLEQHYTLGAAPAPVTSAPAGKPATKERAAAAAPTPEVDSSEQPSLFDDLFTEGTTP